MLNREKIVKYLDKYQDISRAFKDETSFKPGICYVQLGNFVEAKGFFEKSISAMFSSQTLWKGSGQPHWLVDVCILSGRIDLYADVRRELDSYGLSKSENLYFHFSDAVMELLLPSGEDIKPRIERLLAKPKFKDVFAFGLTLQSIINRSQVEFDKALEQLLRVHEGQAKYGDLRWTAEGFLCLPAMALAYVALKQSISINITNDYLNLDYLEFLLK